MLEKIGDVLSQFVFLSPKDLLQLASTMKFKRLKKGEHFIREGDLNYNSAKVITGLLSHYVIDQNGEIKTLLFVPEKKYSGSLQTTMNNQPADENIVALEDSLLLICDVRSLEALAKENIRIQRMMADSYKDIIIEAATRIKFLIAHSEEERYLNFIKTYPKLEKKGEAKGSGNVLRSYSQFTFADKSQSRSKELMSGLQADILNKRVPTQRILYLIEDITLILLAVPG